MDNSNFFGSIKTNLTSSGFALYKNDIIIVLIQTDFPAPVAPAMSKWGSLLKSKIKASPVVVFPTATVSLELDCTYFSELKIILPLTIAVFIGTNIGKKILNHISEFFFRILFKISLTAIAFKLIINQLIKFQF